MIRAAVIASLLTWVAPVLGAEIRCEGVLGNSGESGETLVRFGPVGTLRSRPGTGVVYDRFGTLWSRAGDSCLNRYALDGRMLAQFKIPKDGNNSDQITLVHDTLVLEINGAILTLPISARAGEAAKPLKVKAAHISFGSHDDWIAAADTDEVFLLNVMTGQQKPVAKLADVREVEMGPDGAIYAAEKAMLHKFIGSAEETATGWPRKSPGERLQFSSGYWFTSAYHGTLRRLSLAMEPDPGVVLGGGSGSFIGHLDQNTEVDFPRGVAQVHDGLYALCGSGGILHLLDWQPLKKQFDIVRRIGSVTACTGIGLDRQGNVWWGGGNWRWEQGPDAPLDHGTPALEGMMQAVMMDDDVMIAPCIRQAKLNFLHGTLDREVAFDPVEGSTLPKHGSGSALYLDGKKQALLLIESTGQGRGYSIRPEGRDGGESWPVTLTTSTPAHTWTTLGMKGADTLLAAADGDVLEFSRKGRDWSESRRWNSWGSGSADHFGPEITLAADGEDLWVSDTQRHRVLLFPISSPGTAPRAVFGRVDLAGDDMMSLSHPTTLAARGNRAVVFDSANQRILKLVISQGQSAAASALDK